MQFSPQCHLFVASILLAGSLSEAADWTQFRGPMGQGHADVNDLPVTWSENENIAWKVALPGLGWSSPVVADGRLYLTTAVAEDETSEVSRSLRVLCLSAKNGALLWNEEVFRQQTGDLEIHGKNCLLYTSPSPRDRTRSRMPSSA